MHERDQSLILRSIEDLRSGGAIRMADVQITVRDNGPYLVKGPIELTDVAGNSVRIERETIALCRCGGSANKPFCDGTHSRIGFAAATRAVKEAEARDEG
jgi:3-phenylpropionate/trans-cinnamate dioxygenase ferredoxin subunit